jgi:radical SAM-linked protein
MDLHTRKRNLDDALPWSFIETGLNLPFLWDEYQRGLEEKISPPCVKDKCHRCGICDGKNITVRESDPPQTIGLERVTKQESRKKGLKKKIRLRFKKQGEMRFLSHLELVHLFYRASKRADLPLCFSEGFHPMPRIVFATALPVGMESLMEIVDMELEGRITSREVKEKLNQTLPQGIEILEAEEVPLDSPCSSALTPSVYWVPLDRLISKEEAIPRIHKALEEEEYILNQERKGKKRDVDIRPLIEKMDVRENGNESGEGRNWGVELVLRSEGRRTAKPSEIIEALFDLKGEALSQCKVLKIE